MAYLQDGDEEQEISASPSQTQSQVPHTDVSNEDHRSESNIPTHSSSKFHVITDTEESSSTDSLCEQETRRKNSSTQSTSKQSSTKGTRCTTLSSKNCTGHDVSGNMIAKNVHKFLNLGRQLVAGVWKLSENVGTLVADTKGICIFLSLFIIKILTL